MVAAKTQLPVLFALAWRCWSGELTAPLNPGPPWNLPRGASVIIPYMPRKFYLTHTNHDD